MCYDHKNPLLTVGAHSTHWPVLAWNLWDLDRGETPGEAYQSEGPEQTVSAYRENCKKTQTCI